MSHPPLTTAALDLGSNSIKLTVARQTSDGFDVLDQRSSTDRLGEGVDRTGVLASDRMAAVLATLQRFTSAARDLGATRIVGVATEAVRVAANGPAFIEELNQRFGIEILTIEGEREAQLTFDGLLGTVDLTGSVLIADIGGASTELILSQDERITWSQSFPIGSGRLTELLQLADPPAREQLERCVEEARRTFREVPWQAAGARMIATGGTGEYMIRLLTGQTVARPGDLDPLLDRLSTIPAATLAPLVDLPVARARVLPAGLAIARAIATAAQPVHIEAAQSGIRRGLLRAVFAGEL